MSPEPSPGSAGGAADLIVAGSGVAGLSAALAAAEAGARVLLLTAGPLLSGSSPWAQGGIAAALGADDRPELHAADTLAVGAGLNDAGAVGVLVRAGQRAVRGLLTAGVPFERGPEGPDLGLEAGHGRRRILHAGGGATGRAITATLLAQVVEHPRVQVRPHTPVAALVPDAGKERVVGVRGGGKVYRGRAVVLATGGYAALWGRTTNTPASRGTGLALAWRAGASLADLEFVQFHPTALALPDRPAFLLSEALRGEGALLVDEREEQIVDPLLPRDVVARAIARHRRERGPVYLSLRGLDPAVAGRFPAIAAQLSAWGLDLARDPLPVAPAAHYCMGGVRTDSDGRTDVPGLYVAGEAACTGVQGANRLASNSLLECLVFGGRAAAAALTDEPTARAGWHTRPLAEAAALPAAGATPLPEPALGEALDHDLGVARAAAGLTALLADLPAPERDEDSLPGGPLVAALATRAALLRAESRGAHYRTDAPEPDPRWRGRIHWCRGQAPQFEEIVPS